MTDTWVMALAMAQGRGFDGALLASASGDVLATLLGLIPRDLEGELREVLKSMTERQRALTLSWLAAAWAAGHRAAGTSDTTSDTASDTASDEEGVTDEELLREAFGDAFS